LAVGFGHTASVCARREEVRTLTHEARFKICCAVVEGGHSWTNRFRRMPRQWASKAEM